MTVHSVPRSMSTPFEGSEVGASSRAGADELLTDARLMGASGVAITAMMAVAHAEVAAAITTGLSVVVTVPMWLRARRLARSSR